MKTMIAAGILALLAASAGVVPARATASTTGGASGGQELGLGIILGQPIGGTAKLWLDDHLAVDAGIGLDDGNVGFWGDILWHDWTLLPQPSRGRLGLYLGTGPQLRTGDDERFGVRAIGGISYRPAGHPLELYAEAGPLFELTQGGWVDAVGGVGLRVMIGGARR